MEPEISSGAAPYFDDIIDGYFPLNVSIFDLMCRRGLDHARLVLTQAPIMHIPGLALHEPVPLSLTTGKAGIIHHMDLWAQVGRKTCLLRGTAQWLWLDGTQPEDTFDPNTRLAEPAYVQGQALPKPTCAPSREASIIFLKAFGL